MTTQAPCPAGEGISDLELLTVVGADLYAALDSNQRACVSRKIKKLADEGYDDAKQRVAIAIKHCAPSKSTSKAAAEIFAATGADPAESAEATENRFKAEPLPREHETVKNQDGTFTVKDVPIFGENDRTSFLADAKYDAAWLEGAHKADQKLGKHGYRAPMHFGHHTFAGNQVERAGHYEVTKVAQHKHLGKKTHVLFANLHFKDEATYQKYAKDYPHRSVEISHERPDQINSLALLSHEAPFFQFPVPQHNGKFATEVVDAQGAIQAHYFASPNFLSNGKGGVPPKAEGGSRYAKGPAAKGPKPPAGPPHGDDQGDEGMEQGGPPQGHPAEGHAPPAQQNPGTNENDVVVAMLHGIMGLLNKLVDANLKQIGQDDGHDEPDGDEHEDEGEDEGDEPEDAHDEHDGAKKMSDGKKTQPVVSASADTATLEGQIAALTAEVGRLRKERENEVTFSTLRGELAPYGVANLDVELRKRVDDGTAQAWAAGIKQIAPPTKRNETPSEPVEDPAIGEFLKKNPKADPAKVRHLASVYAAAENSPLAAIRAIRNTPIDRFLAVQLEMEKRS